MARPSETAQVDIGPDEIVKSNSCSNSSNMIDVSLSDLPSSKFDYNLSCWGKKIVVVTPDTSNAMPAFDIEAEYQNMSTS